MKNTPSTTTVGRATRSTKLLLLLGCSTAVLAACGGGNNDEPDPTDKDAIFAVAESTTAGDDGAYGTTRIALTDIEKRNPVGSTPETCSFKFDDVYKIGNTRVKAFGDIRYLPGSANLNVAYITLGGREFTSSSTDNVRVDRAGARVVFTNKLFTGSADSAQTMRLTGFVPMRRDNVPADC